MLRVVPVLGIVFMTLFVFVLGVGFCFDLRDPCPLDFSVTR